MKKTFEVFKILADKTRLQIVLTLYPEQEISCAEVSAKFKKLTQPTLSHHFKMLAKAGLMNVRKDGTANFYSLNKKLFKENGIDLSKLN